MLESYVIYFYLPSGTAMIVETHAQSVDEARKNFLESEDYTEFDKTLVKQIRIVKIEPKARAAPPFDFLGVFLRLK